MIPTAEYYLDNLAFLGGNDIHAGVVDAMKEFAKLHVEEALKQASERAESAAYQYLRVADDEDYNKDLVLSAYPLENIK